MSDPDASPDRLAAESLAQGSPTAWFERLYAGGGEVPWDRRAPHPLIAEWAQANASDGGGRSALVVGAGLGEDAELLASLGWATTAFDVAPTAIRGARARFPGSSVSYVVADLLEPPPQWAGAFALVVESYTVQALPRDVRAQAIAGVRAFVAPGGRLLVVAAGTDVASDDGPPWPLTREEVDLFAQDGLSLVAFDEDHGESWTRWRVALSR